MRPSFASGYSTHIHSQRFSIHSACVSLFNRDNNEDFLHSSQTHAGMAAGAPTNETDDGLTVNHALCFGVKNDDVEGLCSTERIWLRNDENPTEISTLKSIVDELHVHYMITVSDRKVQSSPWSTEDYIHEYTKSWGCTINSVILSARDSLKFAVRNKFCIICCVW